jgi:hypothetical protein
MLVCAAVLGFTRKQPPDRLPHPRHLLGRLYDPLADTFRPRCGNRAGSAMTTATRTATSGHHHSFNDWCESNRRRVLDERDDTFE